MSMYLPNPAVAPTGAEPGEFADDNLRGRDDDRAPDPTRRPTGSPPLAKADDGDALPPEVPPVGE